MFRFPRFSTAVGLLILSLAATVLMANGASASARSDVVGHVYVNGNTAPINTVSGFDRHADGSLTPIPGSPFVVGGSGTGVPTGSQGALQLSADGRYLLAVDAGSNQISVARLRNDGSIDPVGSAPVSSGGIEPLSIAVHGDLVYVANAGAGGSNYTGFRINGGGKLRAISGSTFALPDNALPGDILFNSTGDRLVATRVGPAAGPSFIDSFTVGRDGLLSPAAGSPFAGQGVGAFGSEFRPTDPDQLFVSNAHNGGTNLGTVSAFSDSATGVLTSIGSSPFGDLQNAPCWIEISHDGQFLFAVNTASTSISSFSIASDGSLTLLSSTGITNPAGIHAFDARLDPTGRFLYVVGGDRVVAFSVSGGSLSELPGSAFSLPAGTTAAFGLAID